MSESSTITCSYDVGWLASQLHVKDTADIRIQGTIQLLNFLTSIGIDQIVGKIGKAVDGDIRINGVQGTCNMSVQRTAYCVNEAAQRSQAYFR